MVGASHQGAASQRSIPYLSDCRKRLACQLMRPLRNPLGLLTFPLSAQPSPALGATQETTVAS